MKQLIFLLLIAFSFSVKSQITLEYSSSNYLYPFPTSALGDKYFAVTGSTPTYTVTIYNSDYSLYRQVTLPGGYQYTGFYTSSAGFIPSISDKLFNADSLLEFLCSTPSSSTGNFLIFSIINELGQIDYTFPDSFQNNAPTIYIISGNDYKVEYANSQGIDKIFSLPGSLPCNQCNSLTSGIIEPNQGSGVSGFNVYPNPFNSSLSIQYNLLSPQSNSRIVISDVLGRVLRTIPLTNQYDRLTINTTDIPKGAIIVSLYGSSQAPISKKLIKIE